MLNVSARSSQMLLRCIASSPAKLIRNASTGSGIGLSKLHIPNAIVPKNCWSMFSPLNTERHRGFIMCQNIKLYSSSQDSPKQQEGLLTVYFVRKDGTKMPAKAKVGDNLLDVVVENNIDIDGYGACEGTLACSTCHLIFKQKDFDALPEEPTDEELDMLDLAFDLVDTSRLGCQVYLTKEMDGLEVAVPAGVSDARG